eukprot:m.480069 g.480069  ORF g.480069 m.480069 type:complete len:130 (+) comp21684_c0_seq1:43-432(+)
MAPSTTGLCLLSFFGTIGATMVVLGCALPEYDNWYPMFVILTYVLAPIPTACVSSNDDGFGSSSSSVASDVALFLTAAFVMSGYGIPFVLWHSGKIVAGAAWLVVAGNSVIFSTILAYRRWFSDDDYGL